MSSDTPEIVYQSQQQRELLERLDKFARTDAEILLIGPTGVGKELLALYAHARSARRDQPMVTLNCANLSGDLFENELFGHARGAYTGATGDAHGLASAAEGGTIFFDEVDALPLATQAKLLRFSQSREYRRLGETHLRRCNVRIIAATNSDLAAKVREGGFREDLFFRLRVVPIEIAPLSERPEDIPPLIEHFARRYAAQYQLAPVEFSEAASARMQAYPWPGNVRELENCVRYLTCLQLGRPAGPEDLPLIAEASPGAAEAANGEDDAPICARPLKEAKAGVVGAFENAYLAEALEHADGNVTEAARRSGKHRRAFFELMRRYGLKACDFRPRE